MTSREELACVICDALYGDHDCEGKDRDGCAKELMAEASDAVLAAGYRKLAEDQTWPTREFYADWGGDSGREGYELAQKAAKAAGFRKVVNP